MSELVPDPAPETSLPSEPWAGSEKVTPILLWHELLSEEVWHMAHLDLEARDAAAALLGRAAFYTDDDKKQLALERAAMEVRQNHELFARRWFDDQVATRNALSGNPRPPIGTPIAHWIRQQLETLPVDGLTHQIIAENSGIQRPHFTNIVNGRRTPSLATTARLAGTFAEIRGLTGIDRQLYIAHPVMLVSQITNKEDVGAYEDALTEQSLQDWIIHGPQTPDS